MNASDFSNLPMDERTNYLWDHGVCFGQRLIDNQFILSIFKVDRFFVEARYSRENNRVDAIRIIDEIAEWEAYVDRTLLQLFQLS